MDIYGNITIYSILGILGIIPSIVWLLYYLTKDLHPEPKRQILRIFLWGAAITLPTIFVQLGLAKLLEVLIPKDAAFADATLSLIKIIIQWFFIIAFVEELFKYLVVRIKVISSYALDEPLDLMLYATVSALGFAAVENIFYLLNQVGTGEIILDDHLVNRVVLTFVMRFLGSTFLHTLCSAIIAYFLAMSIYDSKKKYLYILSGIFFSTFFHGIYDVTFTQITRYAQLVIPASILLTLAIIVFFQFSSLQKIKGLCKISK